MILYCPDCRIHPFQDKTYGIKKRVCNPTKEHNKYRCTVCSKINDLSSRKGYQSEN